MKPLTLTAANTGTYPEFTLTFQDGCVALTGANGAGKSTILRALEAALFADGTRDLAPMLGPHGDRMEIELAFEHDGETYRVRRGFNGKRATLDFERRLEPAHYRIGFPPDLVLGDSWEPLSRETTAATQAEIERILGLNRQTFNASAYLAQGNAGAFPQARPADRKALIGEILDPAGTWPALKERAGAERLTLDRSLDVNRARIAGLQARVDTLPAVAERVADLAERDVQARAAVLEAEQALEAAQARLAANAAAAERVRTLTVERDRAKDAHERAGAALSAAREAGRALPAARSEADTLRESAARVPMLEALEREHAEKVAAVTSARAEKVAAEARAREAEAESQALQRELSSLLAGVGETSARISALDHAPDGAERCAVCEQTLGAEARAASIANLRAEHARLQDAIAAKTPEAQRARSGAEAARAAAAGITVPDVPEDTFSEALRGARADARVLPVIEHKVGLLEAQAADEIQLSRELTAAAGTLASAEDALRTGSEGLADEGFLRRAVESARTAVDAARGEAAALTAAIARAEAEHEALQDAEQSLAALVEETAGLHDRLDLLRLAERCYGRDGVPALIVETSAVPAIEAEANRILERLPTADGTVLRVELRTQAALKTDADRLRETLDIVVSDADGERAYETYSGGERARLNVALRVALAMLLARRRGAESRLLALDELEYLDEQGQEALVGVLRGAAGSFDQVLVVSHAAGIRDAFDATLEVVKVDGVSRLEESA